MEPIRISEIVDAVRGKLVQGDPELGIESVTTDSRTAGPGDLFVPLVGERFDGHDYMGAAARAGALGCLTADWPDPSMSEPDLAALAGKAVVAVEDTLRALGDIARLVRRRARIPVVGITGSTGKTTTKDMLTAILGRRFNVTATDKNFNNEIGVPLTIFKLTRETEALVVEMGMRGPGQIQELCRMAEPDVGIITNIGTAHYGMLGSVQAIAHAKAELIESLPSKGVAVLNAENEPWTSKLVKMTRATPLTFGLEAGEVRSRDRRPDDEARYSFILESPWGEAEIRLGQPGLFSIVNATAAAAAAAALGCSIDDIKTGLESFKPTELRMEVIRRGGLTVLNDAYNASPTSMRGALRTLVELQGIETRVAAFGAMLELGDISKEQHRLIGELAHRLGVDHLAVYHEEARGIKCGAADAGMDPDRVRFFDDHESAAAWVRERIGPGRTALLVKGSRGMAMERITRLVLEDGSG